MKRFRGSDVRSRTGETMWNDGRREDRKTVMEDGGIIP